MEEIHDVEYFIDIFILNSNFKSHRWPHQQGNIRNMLGFLLQILCAHETSPFFNNQHDMLVIFPTSFIVVKVTKDSVCISFLCYNLF